MRFVHPAHPGRAVRLAYCLNFAEVKDLDGLLAGLRETAVPLARRLGGGDDGFGGGGFGIGPWLPADLALSLTVDGGEGDLDRFLEFLLEYDLDAFTFNAFPYRGFHEPGNKGGVFRPTWRSPERLAYTIAVSRIAAAVREARAAGDAGSDGGAGRHVSISTHAGMHEGDIESLADLDACAENFALCALILAEMEDDTGVRAVLSLEPEPRSSANDTGELLAFLERIYARAAVVLGRGRREVRGTAEAIVRRHLGACLDSCHAAVEFEDPVACFRNVTSAGATLGKLQFSNALRLPRPDDHDAARERLFGLDEPIFLHQLTARRDGELLRVGDLPEGRAAWAAGDWRGCEEWRCHFHVPVWLDEIGTGPLATTGEHAAATLRAVLDDPERWGSDELHLEIETYTWEILAKDAGGGRDRLDGQEREYRHVIALLENAEWRRANS